MVDIGHGAGVRNLISASSALGGANLNLGVGEESIDLLVAISPVAARVDAQAGEQALIGPGAHGIRVDAKAIGGSAHGEEIRRCRCARSRPPFVGFGRNGISRDDQRQPRKPHRTCH
jgi:hypothetical protein